MNFQVITIAVLISATIAFLFAGRTPQAPLKHELRQDSIVNIKNGDSLVYELLIPTVDSFGEFPMTTVYLTKGEGKPTLIEFQPGGTETNILLFDSTGSSTPPGHSVIRKLDFGHNMARTMNISDFKPGIYYVAYGSCNIFGRYKLVVED